MTVRFGDCVFDREERRLFRGRSAVDLSPKAFRLLECLIERLPRVVRKEELQDLVWPGIFVADGNLARLVTEVRHAIGDDARKARFVRTVYGFGYAFSGEAISGRRADAKRSDSMFCLLWRDREVTLEEGENILGRDRNLVASIDVASVSRHHARIVVARGVATIEDLGSKNGTFRSGRKVAGAVGLSDGDEIRLGTATLTIRRLSPIESTETARSE